MCLHLPDVIVTCSILTPSGNAKRSPSSFTYWLQRLLCRRPVNFIFSLVGSFGLWDLFSLFKGKLDTTKSNKAHVGSVLALDWTLMIHWWLKVSSSTQDVSSEAFRFSPYVSLHLYAYRMGLFSQKSVSARRCFKSRSSTLYESLNQ